MKRASGLAALAGLLAMSISAQAQIFTLEPDGYADGALLGSVLGNVNLAVAGTDNAANAFFKVMAVDDNFDFAPTGLNVFGHDGIPFFSSSFRLRLDFAAGVNFISLDFAGGNSLSPERGRLEVYDSANTLLAADTSDPRLGGVAEQLSILRTTPDIAYAIAYTPSDAGAFGRFDNLSFGLVPVPEPRWPLLLGTLCALAALRQRRGQ